MKNAINKFNITLLIYDENLFENFPIKHWDFRRHPKLPVNNFHLLLFSRAIIPACILKFLNKPNKRSGICMLPGVKIRIWIRNKFCGIRRVCSYIIVVYVD